MPQPPKKLTKAEKDRLKKEEAERKAREEGECVQPTLSLSLTFSHTEEQRLHEAEEQRLREEEEQKEKEERARLKAIEDARFAEELSRLDVIMERRREELASWVTKTQEDLQVQHIGAHDTALALAEPHPLILY